MIRSRPIGMTILRRDVFGIFIVTGLIAIPYLGFAASTG
jgi:hypothetical protein